MVIYGASGHGKVIAEILEANGYDNIIFWDDKPQDLLWQYKVIQPSAERTQISEEMVVAVGSNRIRKLIAERYVNNTRFVAAIHPAANISRRSPIGAGTVVMAGVTINADTRIGNHCIVNTNASVDHDCNLGDYVHISPKASLCGSVTVGEGTHIGAGATIIPNIRIGAWCTIGAGTVVTKDIPDFATVVGIPGRVIKRNPMPL